MATGRSMLLKVIVLGDSGVGQTSLLDRYVCNQFSLQHEATIGTDFLTKEIQIGDEKVINSTALGYYCTRKTDS